MTCVRLFKRTVGIVENDYGGYLMNMSHAFGDVDGDGHLDVVVSGRKGRMVWLENRRSDRPCIEHLMMGKYGVRQAVARRGTMARARMV